MYVYMYKYVNQFINNNVLHTIAVKFNYFYLYISNSTLMTIYVNLYKHFLLKINNTFTFPLSATAFGKTRGFVSKPPIYKEKKMVYHQYRKLSNIPPA